MSIMANGGMTVAQENGNVDVIYHEVTSGMHGPTISLLATLRIKSATKMTPTLETAIRSRVLNISCMQLLLAPSGVRFLSAQSLNMF